ncbi:MAG: hypothetical protein RL205_400 [Actinomycetota bacterium]
MWATVVGGLSSLILVPGPGGVGHITGQWVLAVLLSQGVFALAIVVARVVWRDPRAGAVLAVLAISGAIRGVVLEAGAHLLGVAGITTADVVSRALNSAFISVIGLALIGATLKWRADYRAQYRLLRDRAILLGTSAEDGAVIEPSVLEAWTSMKQDLDSALQAASSRLAEGASPQDLEAAAALLTDAIDVNLRPAARAMWQETVPEDQPIRIGALFYDTIEHWQLPLREILGFFLVVVGIGSLVRSGVIDGGAYTLRYVFVTGLILGATTSLARVFPRRAPLIAIATLVLLPPVILLSDHWIGSVLFGLPADPAGQVIVAIQTPITIVFIAMAVGAVHDRDQVLAALQSRIDVDVALLQGRGERSRRDSQRLSLFVHHSVQSELSAIAMQASEAASTNDQATIDDVRHQARARIEQLEALDAFSPPWLDHVRGRARIEQVVQAWTGILEIDIDLPDESACRADQWELVARVIEEALANSARHSGASRIEITAHRDAEALDLRISDDGVDHAPRANPGMGMLWLDRVVPGEWSLEQSSLGTELAVRIR